MCWNFKMILLDPAQKIRKDKVFKYQCKITPIITTIKIKIPTSQKLKIAFYQIIEIIRIGKNRMHEIIIKSEIGNFELHDLIKEKYISTHSMQ